jgi:hypothetical protein
MIILVFSMVLGIGKPVWSQDTGLIPVPVFTEAGVQAAVTYNSTTGLYTYDYTITNPATNTGEIWNIDVDIRLPRGGKVLSSEGLMIPHGFITDSFDESVAIFKGDFVPMVPVGIHVPSGWSGGVGARGVASFCCGIKVLPGETKGGFELISRGLPTIREIEIEPWWIFMEEGSASEEGAKIAREIEESLKVKKKTIGPTAPPSAISFMVFLETIMSYLDESVDLGWAIDMDLVSSLQSKLEDARSFIEADDPTKAKVALGEFMDLIENATPTQLTSEGRGLLFYNANYLKEALPDTYIPPVRDLTLAPEEATLPLGATHTLTAKFTEDGNPLGYQFVEVEVISGPNEGLKLEGGLTDDDGEATFSYTSAKEGTDRLEAKSGELPSFRNKPREMVLAMKEAERGIVPALGRSLSSYLIVAQAGGEVPEWMTVSPTVEVTWKGGADLAIPLFVPPLIKTEGGNPIFISETTENRGTTQAGPSTTRYFICDDPAFEEWEILMPLGERSIPSLAPGESTQVTELELQVPGDIPAGTYYCRACADADEAVIEINEDNNCEINQFAAIMPAEAQPEESFEEFFIDCMTIAWDCCPHHSCGKELCNSRRHCCHDEYHRFEDRGSPHGQHHNDQDNLKQCGNRHYRCRDEKDMFEICGRLKLPEDYTIDDLEESATLSIAITDESGNDTVVFRERPLKRMGVIWKYWGSEQPEGEGMNINSMGFWWAPQDGRWAGWAGFSIRGILQLPEHIGPHTIPASATVALEIPVSSTSSSENLIGTATIDFQVCKESWDYHAWNKHTHFPFHYPRTNEWHKYGHK